MEDVQSNSTAASSGVPQGSYLGTTLFRLLFNDTGISKVVKHGKIQGFYK